MASQTQAIHTHANYVKIYGILIVLATASVLGPMLGIPALTLITAFGIALVKATMVAAYFMHLNIERRYIWFLLFIMLTFLFVLFAGVAPDVMKSSGQNWRRAVEVTVPQTPANH